MSSPPLPPLPSPAARAPVATPAWGGGDAGLICGYHFDLGPPILDTTERVALPGVEIDLATAERWLAGDEAGFLWLHFNLTHNGAERWLAQHADLSEIFFETLRSGPSSTRIERAEQALLAVINDVSFDFSFEPSDTASLWISADERLLVTTRRQPLRSIDQLRVAVREGEPARSPAELLAHLLRHQADALVAIVRQATGRVDDIEDRMLAARLNPQRSKLGALRRLLVRLQRQLLPEPAALFRLLQHPPDWMGEVDVQDLREATEEFSVVLRDMVALQERIKLLQEEVAAQVNEANGRSLFVLTVVTVLALPINIMAGMLGMNVGGIPLAEHPNGFAIIALVALAFTVIAGWLAFRNKDKD